MASKKLNATQHQEPDEMKMDMSPMIDMVFLLLIFFMVASTLIVLTKDPDVTPPVTPEGQVPEVADGRILVNVYSDEIKEQKGLDTHFLDIDSNPLTEDELAEYIGRLRELNEAEGLNSLLYVRGDREAMVRTIKQVMSIAASAGVSDVIFSGYQSPQAE